MFGCAVDGGSVARVKAEGEDLPDGRGEEKEPSINLHVLCSRPYLHILFDVVLVCVNVFCGVKQCPDGRKRSGRGGV